MSEPSWLRTVDMANARDLGGLPCVGGAITAHGVLLRSESTDQLAGEDVAHLVDELGLALVVDLRERRERRGARPLEDAGVDTVLMTMFENPATAAGVIVDATPEQGITIMADFYVRIVEGYGERALALLDRLLAAEGPALVHCTAGKDRTGIAIALLLGLAGVDHDAIVADYGATEARREALNARLSRLFGAPHPPPRYPPHTQQANPEVMRRVLATIVERHGSVAGWWNEAGIDTDAAKAWRRRLVR